MTAKASPRPPFTRLVLLIGCAVVCCVGLLIGLGALWYTQGEIPNLAMAGRVPHEFFSLLQKHELELAHSMLSENFTPAVTVEELTALVEEDRAIFSNYQRFAVCDWGVWLSDGLVVDVKGFLYYEAGMIPVHISLHRDSDATWRVQGFAFVPSDSTEPYGLCQ